MSGSKAKKEGRRKNESKDRVHSIFLAADFVM